MTLKEFRNITKDLPGHMDICFDVSCIDGDVEFAIEHIEEAKVVSVRFSEGNEPGTEPEAFLDCLVLTTDR